MNYKILFNTVYFSSPPTDVEIMLKQFDLSYVRLCKQDEFLLKKYNDMFVFNSDYIYIAIKDNTSIVGLAVLESVNSEAKLIYFGAHDQGYTSIDGHKFKLDELLFSSVLESFLDTSIDTSLYEEELGLLLK